MKKWIGELLDRGSPVGRLRHAAFGAELEFQPFANAAWVRADQLFPSARHLIKNDSAVQWDALDRATSVGGGAVYFDGPVLECASPIAEATPQGLRRLTSALQQDVRALLMAARLWGKQYEQEIELRPFSVHLSFSDPNWALSGVPITSRAKFLANVLPLVVLTFTRLPGMTTIGVRPRRGGRIELAFGQPENLERVWVTLAVCRFLLSGFSREGIHTCEQAAKARLVMPQNIRLSSAQTRPGWAIRRNTMIPDPFDIAPHTPCWRTSDDEILCTDSLVATWLSAFQVDRSSIIDAQMQDKLVSHLRDKRADRDRRFDWRFALNAFCAEGPDRYHAAATKFFSRSAVREGDEVWMPETVVEWTRFKIRSSRVGECKEVSLDDWADLSAKAILY